MYVFCDIKRVGCDGIPKRYIGRSIRFVVVSLFIMVMINPVLAEAFGRESYVKKGGNTWYIPRPLNLTHSGTRFFVADYSVSITRNTC